MAKVRFNLKDSSNVNENTLIYLIFRYNSKRLKYSTGEHIKPKFWNAKEQRAKNTRQFPEGSELNTTLNNLQTATLNLYRKIKNDGIEPTFEDFRTELNLITFRKEEEEEGDSPKTFLEFFTQLIEEREQSPQFTKGTIKNYQTALKRLLAYCGSKNIKLDYDGIDLDFYNDFTNYLYSAPFHFSTNYVSRLIKNIKTVLHEATERGLNTNLKFMSKKFSVASEEAKNIYLTNEELETLSVLDLSKNKRLEKVRDLFLVGCYTGLRFSDFTNIKPEHIKTIEGVRVIDISTQKTKQSVIIPINRIVAKIFERYNDKGGILPKPLSNQKMNNYLKELGELAGIDEEILDVKSVGGQQVETKKKKYEKISTHTARRSFATNAFKSGVPALAIMKITGHKTQTSFMKYIKINNEENAVLMAKNAFFQ